MEISEENDTLAELCIRDSITGHKVVIDRLEVNEARTTLGVNQCPSGSMLSKVECMKSMTNKWAAQMKAGYLKTS